MSSTYVDGTTPLDAARMNALQQKVEKAAVNGYASLDATGKVPAAQLPGYPTGIPLPVVNGQWIKGVGGAAVWQPIAYADLPGYPSDATKFLRGDGSWAVPASPAVGVSPAASISAANTDITPTALIAGFTIYPNGGGTVRSIVGFGVGARISFWNASPTPVTFKSGLAGGVGAVLQNKGGVDLILNPNEGIDYAWDGGGNWRQIGEARMAPVGRGSSTVTFPGGTPQSSPLTVTHGLASTPTAVVATPNLNTNGTGKYNVLGVVQSLGATTFQLLGVTADATNVGAGVSLGFYWVAIP